MRKFLTLASPRRLPAAGPWVRGAKEALSGLPWAAAPLPAPRRPAESRWTGPPRPALGARRGGSDGRRGRRLGAAGGPGRWSLGGGSWGQGWGRRRAEWAADVTRHTRGGGNAGGSRERRARGFSGPPRPGPWCGEGRVEGWTLHAGGVLPPSARSPTHPRLEPPSRAMRGASTFTPPTNRVSPVPLQSFCIYLDLPACRTPLATWRTPALAPGQGSGAGTPPTWTGAQSHVHRPGRRRKGFETNSPCKHRRKLH